MLLSSLETRPAAAQTAPDRTPDGQGVWGTPDDCPDGFEELFLYKQDLKKFKNDLSKNIPDKYNETVAELVSSADEKPREVDKSLCIKDLPPCPASVFQTGRTPTVYMADPADPLFEHRALDANFGYDEANKRVRGQHVVDFGRYFNAAWLAQTKARGQGYRPDPNNVEVKDHKPFVVMHDDRCVDAVAGHDLPVVPPGFSEPVSYSTCKEKEPKAINPQTDLGKDQGTDSFVPAAKMAFVFTTTEEPPVNMCVRFARKACPPGTLLTDVPQHFKLAAVSGDAPDDESDTDTDDEAPDTDSADPVYVVKPIGEVEVQPRCRGLARREWTCPDGYEPLNQFNRCTRSPASLAEGQTVEPCKEIDDGTDALKASFAGFFDAADCDVYVRGNFFPAPEKPPACSDFGFADISAVGLKPGRDYPRDPYKRLDGYLGNLKGYDYVLREPVDRNSYPNSKSLIVLSEVADGAKHWCKYKTGLLRDDCHGDERPGKQNPDKLKRCDADVMKQESICLITLTDRGGCVGIVRAIECLAVAAAIKTNEVAVNTEKNKTVPDQGAIDEFRSLGASLSDWQDYLNCSPCTYSPFDAGSGCAESPSSSAPASSDQQMKDWLDAYVYGLTPQSMASWRFNEGDLQGALFNRGKDGHLRPLGYPAPDDIHVADNDRAPCPNNLYNRWNLALPNEEGRYKQVWYGDRIDSAFSHWKEHLGVMPMDVVDGQVLGMS